MSNIISAENFPASNIQESSLVASDAAAGQAIIAVQSSQGYAVDDYIAVARGTETGELKKILSISGNNITLTSNLSHKHYKGEDFVKLTGNQIRFYRAANVNGTVPADASFSVISTKNIEADSVETEYIDLAGGSDYWYKYVFYNETTSGASSLANSQAVRGGNWGHYVTIEEVRMEAGLMSNLFITDQVIFDKILAAESRVNAMLLVANYALPLSATPELIKQATRLLAAGWLLTMDYGPEHEGTNKDGERKIKMANDILTGIESGKTVLEIETVEVGQSRHVRGYPDDSAADLTPSEGRAFRMSDRF